MKRLSCDLPVSWPGCFDCAAGSSPAGAPAAVPSCTLVAFGAGSGSIRFVWLDDLGVVGLPGGTHLIVALSVSAASGGVAWVLACLEVDVELLSRHSLASGCWGAPGRRKPDFPRAPSSLPTLGASGLPGVSGREQFPPGLFVRARDDPGLAPSRPAASRGSRSRVCYARSLEAARTRSCGLGAGGTGRLQGTDPVGVDREVAVSGQTALVWMPH